MNYSIIQTLSFINFFFLSAAILFALILGLKWKTELKKSKEFLRRATRYQELCISTSDGVFQCDKANKVAVINIAGALMLGYNSVAEAVNDDIRIESAIVDGKVKREYIDYLKSSTQLKNLVLPIRDKHSNIKHLELTITIFRDHPKLSYEGIFRDVTEKIRIQRELTEHQDQLEYLVKKRTDRLNIMHQKLRNASEKLLKSQEEERKIIARELHDDIGQALNAVKVDLELIKLADEDNISKRSRKQLIEAYTLVEELIDRTHDLALDLRPAIIDQIGLAAAIRWYLDKFQERSGIQVTFDAFEINKRLSADQEIALYRIMQEAMTNVSKHSEAKHVEVNLVRVDSIIGLTVSDDGIGIKPEILNGLSLSNYGIFGMKEKAKLLGGDLEIRSAPNQGVIVSITIPDNTVES